MEIGDIYGLLRYLGLSAENTRFFHVSYAVYLTTRRQSGHRLLNGGCTRQLPDTITPGIFNVKRSVCIAVDRVWGNGKRDAEIHHEVSLEAGASFLRSLLPFLPPTSRTEMQREPLRSTMCLGMQEIIGTPGKAESEASS